MFVGLLMVAEENDILERVLREHAKIVDAWYVLDGTGSAAEPFFDIMDMANPFDYFTDDELPRPPYPDGTVCGYRGFLYDAAVDDLGWDHWFLELHGDEIWTFHPEEAIATHPEADGFIFPLPFYFPREEWDYDKHPLDQLRWHMKPGWPEFRMFKGNPDVKFSPTQHFNTQPVGLKHVVHAGFPIKHYPYRSPEQQRAKAMLHKRTGFDPDNYRHIWEGKVYWDEQMIEAAKCEAHREVACDL